MLGCGWTYNTQFHRYEELAQVPYRYFKRFDGHCCGEECSADMYVRDLDIDPANDFSQAVHGLRKGGLIRTASLWRGEVEAVLAHEVSHAANGDMVTLALIQGVVNTFVIFLSRIAGLLFDRMILRIERGYGPGFWIVSLIMEMVLGVLAMMIVMWFSRWREFRADAGGAALAGRHNMIAALERLKAARNVPPLPEEMRAFAISAGRVQALFASHPPLEKRIAALRGQGAS